MKTITPSKARNGNGKHPDLTKAVEKTLADQVREDGEKRQAACAKELDEVLKKHGCAIRITPVVQIEGRPIQVVVVPLPPA